MVERIALITTLILARPMCLPCITTKSGMAMDETVAIIDLIEGALRVHRKVGHCQACGDEDRPTVFADQPAI
jgi:hypothetical protein